MTEKEHRYYVGWVYAYLLLFIFEGSLRKWILPGLSSPLLMVRFPIVLYLMYVANKKGWIRNGYAIFLMLISTISFFCTMFWGHGYVEIAVFGWHNYFFNFPFVVVAAHILNRDDLLKIGRYILYLSVPMTLLIIAQFYSPQTAWVNRGVGGEGGAGFGGALGYYRPPGTFSFIQGYVSFQTIVCSYLCFFIFENKKIEKEQAINRYVLYICVLCYILSIPYSICRGLLFTSIIIIGVVLLFSVGNSSKVKTVLLGGIVISVLVYFANEFDLFGDSIKVFTRRFDDASETEGGALEGTLYNRYLMGFINSFLIDVPLLGYGIGIATNAGSKLIDANMFTFFDGEAGFGLVIGESGVLLGGSIVFCRLLWGANIFFNGLRLRNNTLSLVFFPNAALLMATGPIGSVPAMGGLVCYCMLAIAAQKNYKID